MIAARTHSYWLRVLEVQSQLHLMQDIREFCLSMSDEPLLDYTRTVIARPSLLAVLCIASLVLCVG